MTNSSTFDLHPQLARDCLPVDDWPLCRLLLMNDRRFPWLILVPRRAAIGQIHELTAADQQTLMSEIHRASERLLAATGLARVNVAALGNKVAQLHVHVIARHDQDAAWPGPVWGHGQAKAYEPSAAQALIEKLL